MAKKKEEHLPDVAADRAPIPGYRDLPPLFTDAELFALRAMTEGSVPAVISRPLSAARGKLDLYFRRIAPWDPFAELHAIGALKRSK